MDPVEYLGELRAALDECRFRDVRTLVHGLQPASFDLAEAAKVLQLLRKKRRFEDLATAADFFRDDGRNEPRIRRLTAQALIDQGNLGQGLAMLRRLASGVEDDPVEGPEVRGLIGRALKQRFVEEGYPSALTEAVDAYEIDGRHAPAQHRWHGINLVACIMRARREGIQINSQVDPEALAREMLSLIMPMRDPPAWDLAVAQEACVALDDKAGSLRWLTAYVKHEDSDAFELASTLRQLKEIWQAGDGGPGGALLPVLEYEQLRRLGGTLGSVAPVDDDSGFQSVYGKDAAQPLQWLDNLRDRCESIARVHKEADGKPMGTGFLAVGSWFHGDWGDDLVFVTNSHVIGETDPVALEPDDALVEFTRIDGRPKVTVGKTLFSSRKEDLDVSILQIQAPDGSKPIKLTNHHPVISDKGNVPVYVAGHPDGRELEVTLYDNDLREVEGPFVRYRSPTEGGNSGSPVMNGGWKGFALHHRTVMDKQLNEGVRFASIREAIGGA